MCFAVISDDAGTVDTDHQMLRLDRDIMDQLSVFDRFDSFVDGVFDLTAVVYDLSVTGVFLFLSVQALEKRRWSE